MADHDILFVNAAIQNRAFSVDERPGKVAGIAAAQLLNVLVGNPEVVHTWNNVGLFDEAEIKSSDQRLRDKYDSDILQEHLAYWGIAQNAEALTDDDAGFGDWAKKLIQASLEDDAVSIQTATFHSCGACNLVIAEAAVAVDQCGKCGNMSLSLITEEGLFVNVPEDRGALLPAERLYNSIKVRQEQDAMRQVPHRLLLSRTRSRGISLEEIGVPGKVLDPRLGIGLLALYAADIKGYQKGCLVQSTSTLVRTAPYLNSVIADPDRQQVPEPHFAAHTKIDQALLMDNGLSSIDRNVLLPLASLRRRNDVTRNDLETLRLETAKVKSRAAATCELFERLGLDIAQGASLPSALEQVRTMGKLNDLLPTIAKVLGRTIEDLKRLDPTQVTGDIRDTAASTAAAIHQSREILR